MLVAGSGAAVQAPRSRREGGAEVLLIEALPRFGGSSAMSAGWYTPVAVPRCNGARSGGQRRADVQVYRRCRWQTPAAGENPPLLQQSSAHFDWLVAQGVPYREELALAMTVPMAGNPCIFRLRTRLAGP